MNWLGKLTWSAIPFDQPIIMGASAMMIVGVLLVLALVTFKGWWPYLWHEWLTRSTTSASASCIACWRC
jgi:cytochrome o ubiquinol oxidase subunit 1